MRSVVNIIRWILALALIYGVYTETGKWTAIFALLVFLSTEIDGFLITRISESVKRIIEVMKL